jgi:hypothetical protein
MNSFDLTKFRNQLLKENTERFYAPTYIVQKYGETKAKEIEANIEDEGANTWDLFTSLETPQEVDNFIGGFLSENTINEDLSYLAAWKVLKGPGGYTFQIQGGNNNTIDARVNKAGMATLDGEGDLAVKAIQQIADQFGTETEVLYGDNSLTTVISEPDFNAIFPNTINENLKEDLETKNYYIIDTEGMEPPMGPLNIMQASAKLLKLGDGYTIIDQATKDEIYTGDDDMEDLDEGTLEEMASFYKLTDNSPEALAAIQATKEKFKPGTTLYNTLDTLEKTGEVDYKALAKQTGKDIATFNNPKSRGVLEKDLAAFVQAGASPSADKKGRPSDPTKTAATPKDKSSKLKITNPKPTSTKLKDLAPASAFDGIDDEEMEMEKQALKAAKGNKRMGTTVEKLAQISKEMKALVPAYQAAKGTPEEAGIVAQLKALTAEKKALEKKTAPRRMTAADLMASED